MTRTQPQLAAESPETRRAFLTRAIVQVGTAAGMAGGLALLCRRNSACQSRSICDGCGKLPSCDLPRAQSARQEARHG